MTVYKYTGIGKRQENQDYIVSESFGENFSLHIVADGIGGYDCGAIASKIVGDSFVYGISRDKNLEESAAIASANLLSERLSLGINKMGCTIAGVLIDNLQASVFWAGDSRVYLFRNNENVFVTEDHSMVNDLQKIRPLCFEDKKRYGHIITRSIMGNDDDHVDIKSISLKSGDEILICSDGLYNDCPIDFALESLRANHFKEEINNDDFDDNHSLIYICI